MAKGILEYDGTAATRVKRVYDWDGAAATRLKKGYDWNGTAATPVYGAETVLFSGGSTAESGQWASGGVGYLNAGAPVVSTYLGFGTGSATSYFGALLWTGRRIDVQQGQQISFYMDGAAYHTNDTNMANGTQHLCKLEVVFGQSKPDIGGVVDVRAKVAESCSVVTAIDGCRGYWQQVVNGSMAAGTYTVTAPATGSFHVGFLWDGYNAAVTKGPGINNVLLEDA